LLDIDLELEPQTASQFRLNRRGAELMYDVKAAALRGLGAQMPLPPIDGRVRLRVLLDRTSIEVFGKATCKWAPAFSCSNSSK
jgi:fructan beta-fructosidase